MDIKLNRYSVAFFDLFGLAHAGFDRHEVALLQCALSVVSEHFLSPYLLLHPYPANLVYR
jgi:hypothetical protein